MELSICLIKDMGLLGDIEHCEELGQMKEADPRLCLRSSKKARP